ncbi:hypothetical protein [Streptomyces lincolnensis]|uniref:hypothetical protein n=1 Tax=Streptomyces lincolnensis TaxID=1915 RepID=UPI0037CFB6F1
MSSELRVNTAHSVCEMAAGGSLRPGTSVADVRVRRVRAWLSLRLNAHEVERRRRESFGPILDGEVLEGLLHLPAGMPVPESSLTARERGLLRRCPVGAVERQDGMLVRRAVRPLRVDSAVVRSPRPSLGCLRRAGRFGGYAATSVWLDGPAEGADLLVMEAAVYGIGVVRGRNGEAPELIVAPRGLPGARHTSAGWLFSEQVFGELMNASWVPQPIL